MSEAPAQPSIFNRFAQALRRSIAARLIVVAIGFMVALAVVALISNAVFTRYMTQLLIDPQLESTLDAIQGPASGPSDGRLVLRAAATDPRFSRGESGFYFEIIRIDDGVEVQARSESLYDADIALTPSLVDRLRAPGARGDSVARFIDLPSGPDGSPLRVAGRIGAEEGLPGEYLYVAAIAPAELDLGAPLFWAFAIFVVICSIAVAAITVLQVHFSLQPMSRLRADIAAVRKGQAEKLAGEYPDELAPVTDELNALIDHNREVVERARRHVGNLAHALKTPIAVLKNAAESGGAGGAMLKGTVQEMEAFVERQLRRARVAARAEARAGVQAGAIGYRTPVRQNLEDMIFMMEQRYEHEKALDITLEGQDVTFRGEREDLLEMAANLIDNACKYGKSRVAVTIVPAEAGHDLFEIVVEDDGVGLEDEKIALVLQRGARLDEAAPGQGLGLSILTEAVSLYAGELKFERSALGGLKARLRLPATD